MSDLLDDIKSQVLNWNIDFPIDRWWREKHKVPFMSSKHREVSFLDQYFEYQEFLFFNREVEEEYKPNIGDWLKEPDDEKESQEAFIRRMREEAKDLFKEEDYNG